LEQVSAGEDEMVRHAVLEKPRLVRSQKLNGQSALHIAAAHGYDSMLGNLLGQARRLGETLEAGDAAAPIGGGQTADAFMRRAVNAKNSSHQTPLMLAAAGGHVRCVELLLEQVGRRGWFGCGF
jgi:ankyrin repeat protein